MSVAKRLHIFIVLPLIAMTLLVAAISARGLSNNASTLDHALRTNASLHEAYALMLVQEAASEAILMDPDRLADYSSQKLEAYDKHKALLAAIRGDLADARGRQWLATLERIDRESLRPLDTQILEELFVDPGRARKRFFEQYEPQRILYESTVREMLASNDALVLAETEALPRKNLGSLAQILAAMGLSIAVIAAVIQILGRRVERAQEELHQLLRGMEEGMFFFDSEGRISSQRSQKLAEILPESASIATLPAFMERFARFSVENTEATLRLLWSEEDPFFSPFEATVSLLPREIRQGEGQRARVIRLSYKPGRSADGELERVYVHALDVTSEIETERKAMEQQERADRLEVAASDPDGFIVFHQEIASLLGKLRSEADRKDPDLPLIARHLHTLKGSSATSGFRAVARRAHEIEDRLADDPGAALRELPSIESRWLKDSEDVRRLLQIGSGAELRRVSAQKLAALLGEIEARGEGSLIEAALSLDRRPLREALGRHVRYVSDLAARRGQRLPTVLFSEASEVSAAEVGTLDPILPHLLRNSIDHGIEDEATRMAAGKPPHGTIEISCERHRDGLRWIVRDDGRGIDVDALAAAMVAKGAWSQQKAATASYEEKLALVFAVGLSSAVEVTETSGRGVGMDAVRAHVHAQGGALSLTTRPGHGATITIDLPHKARLRSNSGAISKGSSPEAPPAVEQP